MINRKIVVRGKVQGVFFRASALEKALMLGITGTVRNLNNGSVEVEAEGEPAQVELFTDWCRKGPDRASVKEVEVLTGTVKGFSDFKIIR